MLVNMFLGDVGRIDQMTMESKDHLRCVEGREQNKMEQNEKIQLNQSHLVCHQIPWILYPYGVNDMV